MTDHGKAVWQLLRAYVAYAGGLRTSTGNIVARASKPGEAPSHRIECPACDGTKKRRVRGVSRPCDECIDTIETSKTFGQPTGRITVDRYTGKRKAGEKPARAWETGADRSLWEHETELALERIEATLRLHAGEEAEHDSFSAAYATGEKLLAQGSFPQLRQALAWLEHAQPIAHSLVWQGLIYAPFGPPEGGVRAALEVICDVLAAKIGGPITVPPWARDAADWRDRKDSLWRGRTNGHAVQRDDRKREMLDLHAASTPVAAIARRFRVSERQVFRIVADSVATVAA